ncbi:MAG: SdpI family protein [Defluviitaleaceae bacterium]|nr:SdpI family protein [Defluviitaleaceae bacterium]
METSMFIVSLLLPLTLIFLGFMYRHDTPTGPNYFAGFRTRRSMQNEKTWEFAHRFGGRIWFFMGLVTLPMAAIAMFLVIRHGFMNVEIFAIIVIAVQFVLLMASYVVVDIAIDRRFGKLK